MATLDQAIQQMLASGMPEFPPGHPRVNTGRIVRYGPKAKAWYRLYEYQARNGRFYISGAFGFWQGNDSGTIKIESNYEGMEIEERERLQRSQAELERREQAKIKDRATYAARRAQAQWDAGRATGSSPYLVRKGLQSEDGKDLPEKGLRVAEDGTLLVPMVRYDVTEDQANDPLYTGPRRLAGLQKIAPDGGKRFNKGMAKMSTACRIGPKAKDGRLLIIGEGLATVLSAHLALEKKYTFFVAFDSGNLMPVAKILRKLYPKSPILFIADDDAYLEAYLNKRLRSNYHCTELFRADFGEQTYQTKHGPVIVHADEETDSRGTQFLRCGVNIGDKLQTFMLQNPGRTAAWDASSAIGNAWVCWPQFVDRALERDPDKPRLTDYNDLHLAEGLDRVREQLLAEVKAIIVARQFAEQIGKGVPADVPTEKAGRKGKGGGGKNPPPELHYDWDTLFNRFTLIYPSETVWDAEREQIVKLQHVKISFGTGIVNYWLGSPSRRTVNDVDVVFDPACKVDPKTSVNLFRGIRLKPDAGKSCVKLIELLRYLCGEQEEHNTPVSDWVLKWMAFPLQNMGAKMQTAIVMHGKEGAGKNMFWGALAEIYGNYAGLINQFQLQTQFNDWISRKLFVIANEVLTRMEMKHLAGYLKNLVTEPIVPIETKNMPMRYEANHMQLVFLSNEIQPLLLGPSDRRYAVVKTPDALPPDIYEAVAAELRDGGAAALYQYLLELDLREFKEQTRPPWTQAKSDLIELALTSPQSFWQDVSDEIVPLPYVPGDERDWYQAYLLYCARTGEKNPAKLNKFSAEFKSMNGVKRVRGVRVRDPDRIEDENKPAIELKQRVVFYMGERPEGITDDAKWLSYGMKKFRVAFREWQREGRPAQSDAHDEPF